MVVRPTLLYGTECQSIKNSHVSEDECSGDKDAQMDVVVYYECMIRNEVI